MAPTVAFSALSPFQNNYMIERTFSAAEWGDQWFIIELNIAHDFCQLTTFEF
jgi:hypothetical protein